MDGLTSGRAGSQDQSFASGSNSLFLNLPLARSRNGSILPQLVLLKYMSQYPVAKCVSMKSLVGTEMDLRVHRDRFSFSWMVSLTFMQSKNMIWWISSPLFVHYSLSQVVFWKETDIVPRKKQTRHFSLIKYLLKALAPVFTEGKLNLLNKKRISPFFPICFSLCLCYVKTFKIETIISLKSPHKYYTWIDQAKLYFLGFKEKSS